MQKIHQKPGESAHERLGTSPLQDSTLGRDVGRAHRVKTTIDNRRAESSGVGRTRGGSSYSRN